MAIRACPQLAKVLDRAFVLTTRDYHLSGRHALGLREGAADHAPLNVRSGPGDSHARIGVLDFYVADPIGPELVPAAGWLATRAPSLT